MRSHRTPHPTPRVLAAAALSLMLLAPGAVGAGDTSPMSPEWAQSWQDDLRYLARELPKAHPDPFTVLPRSDFETRIDELIESVPEMTHHQIVVELARLVASLRDGHTRVTLPLPEDGGFFLGHSKTPSPEVPGLLFRSLPVRLLLLDDGLVVESIRGDHAAAVGAEVLAIGELRADQAMAAVAPVVHRDNEQQLAYQLPDYLVLPDVLAATGVVTEPSVVDLEVAPAEGKPFTVRLTPTPAGEPVQWAPSRDPADADLPLHRRHNDRKFWFEHLAEERTVYFQYNEVGDEEEETLAAFAERLFGFIDDHGVDRLIIDLRRNRGGNNGLNQALLHGLIRSDRLRAPGSLFVITGGGTFSAAMMFSVDLALHTQALFVGAPTGSSPNHFGDSRKLRLPRTGLTVRVSSLTWQYSDPRDDRRAIVPHLPTAATVADFRRGRDAALETILHPGPPFASTAEMAGSWRGRVSPWRWTFDLTVQLRNDGGGWSGTIDVPDLAVTGQPLEEVTVEEDRVRFVFPRSERRFLFDGRTEGRRIYGRFSYGSQVLPFVLTHEEAAGTAP